MERENQAMQQLCAAETLLMLQSVDTHMEACTQTPTMTYKDEETQTHTYTQDSCTQTTKVTISCNTLCVHTIGCPTDEVAIVLVTHNKLPLNLQVVGTLSCSRTAVRMAESGLMLFNWVKNSAFPSLVAGRTLLLD